MTARTYPVAEACAKINLTLHVTGQRADGYHLLDSLVVFLDHGDIITFEDAPSRQMTVSGPFAAGVPTGPENLIWRAVDLVDPGRPLEIHLEKKLPHGAGIGGGSSDAAKTLHVLTRALGCGMPGSEQILSLGADIPVCVRGRPTRMQGIGEQLSDVLPLPFLSAVIVNPGIHLPTGQIFNALKSKTNPPMDPMDWGDFDSFITWCAAQRNDLQAPALKIAPELGRVLDRIEATDGCVLARMTGSGSSCFGLFAEYGEAREAAARLQADDPDWWVIAEHFGPS